LPDKADNSARLHWELSVAAVFDVVGTGAGLVTVGQRVA
jgi:hypothetical protein